MARSLPTVVRQAAVSGVYIDFEGTIAFPAMLLGVLWADDSDTRFEQHVMDQKLFLAADAKSRSPFGYCLRSSWETVLDRLESLISEGRSVFAYSDHERDVILSQTEHHPTAEGVAQEIVNVRPIAVRWKRRHYPDVIFRKPRKAPPRTGKHSLRNFLDLIEYEFPAHVGRFRAASQITAVQSMLEQRDSYDDLTPVVKAKWTKLLQKNFHDCNGLRELMIRVADDTDRDGSRH